MSKKITKNESDSLKITDSNLGLPMAAQYISLPENLPDNMTVSVLADEEVQKKIKLIAREAVRTESAEDARILLAKLDKAEGFESLEEDVRNLYEKVKVAMSFLTFSNKKIKDIVAILASKLIDAVKIGIDIKDQLDSVFIIYGVEPEGYGSLEKMLILGLEKNEQVIGSKKINLMTSDEPVQPTVKHWLADYNQSTSRQNKGLTGAAQRGGVERATYLSQSSNVQRLDQENRDILRKVLELYDWISFAPKGVLTREYKSLMTPRSGVKSAPGRIPGLESARKTKSNSISKSKVQTIPKPPLPIAPKPTLKAVIPPPAKPLPDIIKKPPVSKPPISQAPAPRPAVQPKPQTDQKQIQSSLDELNKIREQFEKPKNNASDSVSRPRSSVSVNEAIIRDGRNGNADSGEIVSGDKEIDEKLDELEKKVKESK